MNSLNNLENRIDKPLCFVLTPLGDKQYGGGIVKFDLVSEQRTRLSVELVNETCKPAGVRQRAIFSSFSLPDAQLKHPVWDSIEFQAQRNEYYRALLRDERRALEGHVRMGGCSLILSPVLDFVNVGARVHRVQLEILREFLTSMPRDMITVAIVDSGFSGNLTIIGDWFAAKAVAPQPRREYRQTVFTQHGLTVLRWVDGFDQELENSLHALGIGSQDSRENVVTRIEKRLRELPMG